jgi:hypothetical protein
LSLPHLAVSARHIEHQLTPLARLPGMRALAWSGNVLYASRRYRLLRATVQNPSQRLIWEALGEFHSGWKRSLSASNGLSARLFRDGFHSLAVLPDAFVGAVPGAIITLKSNQREFRIVHKIARGTRPLHVTATPAGSVFWGEYFDNASREEVHIYGSFDGGATWNVVHTFQKGAIRHVHNIVHDPWQDCLWVLTGDYGDECRLLRASCDFSQVEVVLKGNQQARAVAAVPTEDGLYFSSDTPLESNFIYRLDRNGNLSKLTGINSSSIYGCRVGGHLFFSTMVEPSEVNRDRVVRVYSGAVNCRDEWQSQLSWVKDRWPMRLFQYGNAIFPDGHNTTPCLALTTIAVQSDDMVTSVYQVGT